MFATEIYLDRRNRLVRQFNKALILLLGNVESPINAFENCYPYRQDSSFLYFCGLDRPGLALLLDVDEGREVLFGQEQTDQNILWSGLQPTLQEQAELCGIQATASIETLKMVVRKALDSGRTVHYLPSCRAENAQILAELLGLPLTAVRDCVSAPLIRAVVELRSVKVQEEIEELGAEWMCLQA